MTEVKLPQRPFLYTMDQICTLISCSEQLLKQNIAHFKGRTITKRTIDEMLFINISSPEDKPEWRVEETELLRWLRRKGFKVVGLR
jgi:hypothetical protein